MSMVPSAINKPGEGPFPSRAVFILALCLTVNAYTLTNLFPYVGMMVKHLLGLETMNEAGFYAGYVASAFTFGRFCSGYIWGHASDKIGRKSVIVIGLLAIAVLSTVFGLSTTFVSALISRFVLGLFNGIMAAVRTTTREICGEENVVSGITYLNSSKGIGMVLGTGLGGLLAEPVLAYPSVFSATGPFARYPFLLPNLLGACFALVALLLVIIWIPETMHVESKPPAATNVTREAPPARNGSIAQGSHHFAPPAETHTLLEETAKEQDPMPRQPLYGAVVAVPHDNGDSGKPCDEDDVECNAGSELGGSSNHTSGRDKLYPGGGQREPGVCGRDGILAMPNVKMLLLMAPCVQVISIGFEEVYPLWALSTPDVGGLGWSIKQIGQALATTGVVFAILQLGILPGIIKRIGIVKWQRYGCMIGIITLLTTPSTKMLSWNETSLFVLVVLANVLFIISVSSTMIALTVLSTAAVPPNQRGKFGGLFITAESIGRFMGPAGFSNMYAWSISPSAKSLGYRFVFVLAAIFMGVVGLMGWRILSAENLPGPTAKVAGSDPTAGIGSTERKAAQEPLASSRGAVLAEQVLP